jgi:hypothetical protein
MAAVDHRTGFNGAKPHQSAHGEVGQKPPANIHFFDLMKIAVSRRTAELPQALRRLASDAICVQHKSHESNNQYANLRSRL